MALPESIVIALLAVGIAWMARSLRRASRSWPARQQESRVSLVVVAGALVVLHVSIAVYVAVTRQDPTEVLLWLAVPLGAVYLLVVYLLRQR
jgi:hypothetical protein